MSHISYYLSIMSIIVIIVMLIFTCKIYFRGHSRTLFQCSSFLWHALPLLHLSPLLCIRITVFRIHAFSFFFPFPYFINPRSTDNEIKLYFLLLLTYFFPCFYHHYQLLIALLKATKIEVGIERHICRTVILVGTHHSGRSVFGRTRLSSHRE